MKLKNENGKIKIYKGGCLPLAAIPLTTQKKPELARTSLLRSGISATPSAGTPASLQSKLDFNTPIICLTGQMAAGKNFVCSLFEEEGFVSLDLDKTAHEAISLCTPQILEAFEGEAKSRGISLQNADGSLNRRALGQIVFSSPLLLARQEGIVYPKIIELSNHFIEQNAGKSVILNATVLFKTPELLSKCGKILFVKANFFKRLLRAKKRDKMPFRQILARFKNQRNLFAEYQKAAAELNIPIEIIKN